MKITETVNYSIEPELAEPNELVFMNRKGGYDTLLLTKFSVKELDIKPETFNAGNATKVYKVDGSSKETYYSTLLNPEYYEWLKDLAVSPVIYINNEYKRISALKGFDNDNYNDLWSFEITVAPEYSENKITL